MRSRRYFTANGHILKFQFALPFIISPRLYVHSHQSYVYFSVVNIVCIDWSFNFLKTISAFRDAV